MLSRAISGAPWPVLLVLWALALVWLIVSTAWRLGAWIGGNFVEHPVDLELAQDSDAFYRSPSWRSIAWSRRLINRFQNWGRLKCECCGCRGADEWHVDHVYPRSTHPEKALSLPDTQLYCAGCNIEKGNRFVGRGPRENWKPNPRLKRRKPRVKA